MVAQEWSGRRLESSVYFEPDDQGLDLFAAYLKSFKREPVRLMVDLIEEEFRQVKIPLLRGSDRKAIIQRNFTKYFRNSNYRHAISQSIEKKTRKEENVLLMGLTNQYLLEPWLKIVDETKTPLSGILSLPLVSQAYIGEFGVEDKATILVSQQVPSNLRQSVFVGGKLILSRLVPIASFYQGDYAADVIRDIESTQRYLLSQRIVEGAEGISIQILTNKRHFDKLKARCSSENYADFKIHLINDVLSKENIEIYDDQDFSSGLFCYLASKGAMANHYGLAQERRYYQHHLANFAMKVASIMFLAVGVGLGSIGMAAGWYYDSTAAETALIEQKYRSKYNQLNENFINSTTSTKNLQSVVEIVDLMQKRFLSDPEELMSLVSREISLFSDLRVKRMQWFTSKFADTGNSTEASWGRASKVKNKTKSVVNKKKASPNSFFEIAVVEAQFLNFDGDYRYALSTVDDLENALIESGNYFLVDIIKRPLDIEPENTLSGDFSVSDRAIPDPVANLTFRVAREVTAND